MIGGFRGNASQQTPSEKRMVEPWPMGAHLMASLHQIGVIFFCLGPGGLLLPFFSIPPTKSEVLKGYEFCVILWELLVLGYTA